MQSASKDISPKQALALLTEGDAALADVLHKPVGALWKELDANRRDPYTRRELFQLLKKLSNDELDALGRLIIALLAAQKKNFSGEAQNEDVQTQKTAGEAGRNVRKKKRVTIRVEYRKCGKNCRCNGGRGHGPYRYMYWWENGRLHSRYLGRA